MNSVPEKNPLDHLRKSMTHWLASMAPEERCIVRQAVLAEHGAAASTLEAFKAETANMSAEACAAELEQYGLTVTGRLAHLQDSDNEPGPDPFAVTETFTLSGLRHEVARRRFLEQLLFGPEGDES